MEQLWNFACPVAIALLHPSLLPVAVIGLFTKVCATPQRNGFTKFVHNIEKREIYVRPFRVEQLAVIVGGPLVGNLMDQVPRITSYNCLTVVQVVFHLVHIYSVGCKNVFA